MWQYNTFLLIIKHHTSARPHSHVQRKNALFWGPKHLKYNNNVFITIKYMMHIVFNMKLLVALTGMTGFTVKNIIQMS